MENNPILSRFLKQTSFVSEEDYAKNLEFIIPKDFNFAYDVVDAWAEEAPDKIALIWTNDEGDERKLSFADLKKMSNQIIFVINIKLSLLCSIVRNVLNLYVKLALLLSIEIIQALLLI